MVWLKALPGYIYQSDVPDTPTITSWGAEFEQTIADAILAEAAQFPRRNSKGGILVVTGEAPLRTPGGGGSSGGGGTATGGVSQEDFDAAIATLQSKATAATDSELAAAVATINTALAGKQSASTAVTDDEFAAAVATLQSAATAATDAELASAIAGVNTALVGKQDAASAATDAEVASAVATLNTAIGLKQDAATAATDAEVAAAVATINTALAGKQDSSTAATDAELSAAIAAEVTRANSLYLIGDFSPFTVYAAHQMMMYQGQLYRAKVAFTSGAAFDPADWDMMPPGLLASAEITADVAITTDKTWQSITELTVTPPLSNRPVLLEVNGVALSHVALQNSAALHVGIYDVTAGIPVAARTIDYPTAARWAGVPSVRKLIPAGAASHTYRTAIFAGTTNGVATLRTSGGLGWLMTAMQV